MHTLKTTCVVPKLCSKCKKRDQSADRNEAVLFPVLGKKILSKEHIQIASAASQKWDEDSNYLQDSVSYLRASSST